MFVLHVEHEVPDYGNWKRAFDDDPLNRKASGVQRHRVFRGTDNANLVTIELEFDSQSQADAMLIKLRDMWSKMPRGLFNPPTAQISEIVEAVDY